MRVLLFPETMAGDRFCDECGLRKEVLVEFTYSDGKAICRLCLSRAYTAACDAIIPMLVRPLE